VTVSREFLRRLAHRAVFDCGSYDVLALRAGFERGMKGRVVRFCAATGEHDLARLTTEEGGDLLSRLLDGVAYLRREPIAARWIGEIFFQIRSHCFQHRWIDRRRRVVIEISNFVRRHHGTIDGISLADRCKPLSP